jgi:hypothetical protein
VGRRLAVLALDPARAAAISVVPAVPGSERVPDPADGSATGAAAAPVARPRQRRIAFLRDRRLDEAAPHREGSVSIESNQLSYGFASAPSPLASWYHSSWRNIYAPSNSNQFRYGTQSGVRPCGGTA